MSSNPTRREFVKALTAGAGAALLAPVMSLGCRTAGAGSAAAATSASAGAGGGRGMVPAGRFLTGPIHLRSRVNLHVSEGATVAFHPDPARYLPAVFTRFEGMELMGYSPFIYAFEQENIAITGAGTLDGQAD